MKEQTKGAIVTATIVACALFMHQLMIRGLSLGSVSDFLIRRCLFIFVLTFIAGGLNVWYRPKRFNFGPSKYPWLGGLVLAAIFEWGGVLLTISYLRAAKPSSVIYGEWLSQWWIILIALSLGALGGHLGNMVMRKWKGRSQKKTAAA